MENIGVKVTAAARKEITKAARLSGKTFSEWVREAVSEKLDGDRKRELDALILENLSEILRVVKGFEIIEDAPNTPTKAA